MIVSKLCEGGDNFLRTGMGRCERSVEPQPRPTVCTRRMAKELDSVMKEHTGVEWNGGNMRVARSKGAVSGILLILLGAWGGLIPFVGPYFSYGYTPNVTWHWDAARFWYEALPGS